MPVQIGSQSDVPDSGDPILSPWYQSTSTMLRHIFASKAALDAQWATAPNGAHAWCIAENAMYNRVAGTWIRNGPDHYYAAAPSNVAIGQGATTLATQAMPAVPAGTLLQLGWTYYVNTTVVGTGPIIGVVRLNGTGVGPATVMPDRLELASYGGSAANIAPPVNTAYTLTLTISKTNTGGTSTAQGLNSTLSVVVYRP